MISIVNVKRHCGHLEKKLFVCRKKNFVFHHDWEIHHKCKRCEPDTLRFWEVASYLTIGIGILTILYLLGIIQ